MEQALSQPNVRRQRNLKFQEVKLTIVIKRSTQSFTVVAPIKEPKARLIGVNIDPDHCVNCGGNANLLYWTGSVMRCTGCDHAPQIDRGMNFKAFKDRIAELVSLELLEQLPHVRQYIRED
jgi:hypothetical protein